MRMTSLVVVHVASSVDAAVRNLFSELQEFQKLLVALGPFRLIRFLTIQQVIHTGIVATFVSLALQVNEFTAR